MVVVVVVVVVVVGFVALSSIGRSSRTLNLALQGMRKYYIGARPSVSHSMSVS